MIALLRHLLDAAYLYAPRAGPVEARDARNVALLAGLLVGAALAWRGWRALPRGSTGRWMWAASGGALLASGALYAVGRVATGPVSARVWYLSALALAVVAAAAATFWGLLARIPAPFPSPDDISGRPHRDAPLLPWGVAAALTAAHLAGLTTLMVRGEAGWWLPALAFGCLAVAGWRRVQVLSPLVLCYGGWALRVFVGDGLGVDYWAYLAFPYPDPWSPWFDRRFTLLAGVAATLVVTAGEVLRRLAVRPAARQRCMAASVVGVAALWFTAMVVAHRSYGATGSDAFCYLQMAADLARHGTARHLFPLAPMLWEHGLPAWPSVPVGYHPPDPTGMAATVWPIGWPLALAGLIRLGGEALAPWGAPLCALLAAWLTYRLARELAPEASPVAGALAAAIVLTSHEGVLRALVPMADAAAQALSVAALLCLWHGRRRDGLAWSALGGLAFAAGYWVRHPLLPLGLAAIPAALMAPWPRRRRWVHLGVFGAAALAGALPDLAYHRMAFGSIWTTESTEWSLLAWRHILPSAVAVLRDGLLRRDEFGYLAPLVLAGIVWQWRGVRHRGAATTLWAGFGGVLCLNLAYSALRPRDLLPLFPWMALWAGWGAAAVWRWAASRKEGGRLCRAVTLLAIVMVLAARAAPTMTLPWQAGVWTFGHVTADQRAAYDALARALPPDAVVATGLNAGAVTHYAGRDTVRPAPWTDKELQAFAALLAECGRPFYLLVDGEEMEEALARAGAFLTLEPAGSFDLPVMGRGGQWQQGPATLYAARLER